MYKKKPFFIVFEGVEGCGKSYQSKKLFNKLKKNKIDAIGKFSKNIENGNAYLPAVSGPELTKR